MEHEPGAEVLVFFNDLRACGKGFEELYKRSIDEGMCFIRAIPSVHVNRSTNNPVIVYEGPDSGQVVRREVDIVVLACGVIPSEGTKRIQSLLGLGKDIYGFIRERHPVDSLSESSKEGIFIAGTCQGPKDIPDAATHGSAAAMKVGIFLYRGSHRE